MFADFLRKKSKIFKNKNTRRGVLVFLFSLALVGIFIGGFWLLESLLEGRVYPGVSGGGQNLSSLKREEAKNKIKAEAELIEGQNLILEYQGKKIPATLSDLGVGFDVNRMEEEAYKAGREENFLGNYFSFFENAILGFKVPNYFVVNEETLNNFVTENLEVKEAMPKSAEIIYQDGKFNTTESRIGKGIDYLMLSAEIIDYINNPTQNQIIQVPDPVLRRPELEEYQAAQAKDAANQVLETGLEFRAADKQWSIERDTLAGFLMFEKAPMEGLEEGKGNLESDNILDATYQTLTGVNPPRGNGGSKLELQIDRASLNDYLVGIAPGVSQPAVNARLKFEDNEVKIEAESHDGIELDMEESMNAIEKAILKASPQVELAVNLDKAQISKDNLEELGIKTLVGRGTSNFSGSPKNRRHNIATGAAKFDGLLIKPEAMFSFLDNLGPVDASTGYLPELVIKNNKTVPEYGGGMCQVSTTAFRGAVNSGFEIYERRNHAYPVQYYAPQGTDATVYIPSPDLKFINNTPSNVYIQTIVNGNELIFEYYGTSDGRKVETEGPFVYDRQPDGAMKARWIQKVYREDGSLMIDKTFLSKYDSPSKYPHPGEEQPQPDKKKKKKN